MILQEFACKMSNKCINKAFVCDGEYDCPDGTDEDDCNDYRKECTKGEKSCPAFYGAYGAESGHVLCIPETSWCNGVEDCPDGGDEKGCNFNTTGKLRVFDSVTYSHIEFQSSAKKDSSTSARRLLFSVSTTSSSAQVPNLTVETETCRCAIRKILLVSFR